MFRAALRSLLARKMRLVLTALSIVLGVGFMAGTYVLTDTMTKAFNDLVETGTASVDVFVRASNEFTTQSSALEERESLPETVLTTVGAVPGVAEAVGDVIGYAQVVDPHTGKVMGTFGPPTAASSWNDMSGFELKPGGSPPSGPDQVVVDAATAERADIGVGDRVEVLFEGPPREFEVVGVAGYGTSDSLLGATWVLFDLPTAQRVLGRQGELDSISIVAEEGVPPVELQRRVSEVLPQGAEAVTAATLASEQQDQINEGLGFFRTALLVFAFVALFVGAFIIFNTFAIIVAQRTRELGLLRAIGATQRQVMVSVVVESVVLGVVASAIGVLAGIGIALGLQALLSTIGLELPGGATVLLPRTVIVSIAVGTIITVIASVVPARRAGRVAPVQALREAQDVVGRSLRFRIISGGAVLAIGIGLLLYGLFGGPSNALLVVSGGVLLTFIGVAMLTPLVARPVARFLGTPIRRTVPGKLGRENAMRNPRRTAATASALMIGLGLVVFVAVFGASAKASVTATLERTLQADFVLTSPTFTGFSTTVADDAADVEGVRIASPIRQIDVRVEGSSQFLSGIEPGTFEQVATLDVREGSLVPLSLPNTVAVLDDQASDHGWSLGDTIEVSFAATGPQRLQIVAIYDQPGVLSEYTTSLDTYQANVTQQLDTMVLVNAAPNADLDQVQAGLDEALASYPNVEVQDQAAFRDKYAQFLNQVLNLLTALLLMAVIIAIFGIVNTLTLSIYERTRELGLLRAIGLDRRQTRAMVRWEAVIIAVMGALFGVVVGVAFGWALQQALEPQGFTELGVPGVQLGVYVILAGLAGVVAAIVPARRAAKLNVLQAIAYE